MKKREEFMVTVKSTRFVESNFGTSTLHIMRTDEGNMLVWFATGSTDLEPDKRYRIKATVKAHREYKERKQTMVNRVAILEEF